MNYHHSKTLAYNVASKNSAESFSRNNFDSMTMHEKCEENGDNS